MGFSFSVDPPWWMPTGQAALQCSSQALFDKLLTHSLNRCGTHVQSLTDPLISPAWPFWTGIGLEQNMGMQEFSCCGFPAEIIWWRNVRSSVVSLTMCSLFTCFPLSFSVAQGYNTVRQFSKW
jgi:hypothetical protein